MRYSSSAAKKYYSLERIKVEMHWGIAEDVVILDTFPAEHTDIGMSIE